MVARERASLFRNVSGQQCPHSQVRTQDLPNSTNPANSLPCALCSKSLYTISVNQLEGAQKLNEIVRARSGALFPCRDTPDVVLGAVVMGRRNAADFGAVDEIQGNDASASTSSDPRENELS